MTNRKAVISFSSREFAHDLARVKRAALQGPVFITDRGRPAYALMGIDDYRRLSGASVPARSLLEAMQGMPASGEAFEPGRIEGKPHPADLD